MPAAIDTFDELDNRISRTVELVRSTQTELAGARAQISRLEREVGELRRERDVVKNRIESLLENLSELTEEPGGQSETANHRR